MNFEIFDVLDKVDAKICDPGSKLLFIFQIARWVIRILQIAVPFALIIWGSLDFFKAVIAGDEKAMKEKRKPFVQRIIAAVIILLLPTLVNIIMKNVAKTNSSKFATCWNNADPSGGIEISGNGDELDW